MAKPRRRPDTPKTSYELRQAAAHITLNADQVELIKEVLRNTWLASHEMQRRGERPPGGNAARYIQDWKLGRGMLPKELYQRLKDNGYSLLVPTNIKEFEGKLAGRMDRPISRDLLRAVFDVLDHDAGLALPTAPRRPWLIDELTRELLAILRLASDQAEQHAPLTRSEANDGDQASAVGADSVAISEPELPVPPQPDEWTADFLASVRTLLRIYVRLHAGLLDDGAQAAEVVEALKNRLDDLYIRLFRDEPHRGDGSRDRR